MVYDDLVDANDAISSLEREVEDKEARIAELERENRVLNDACDTLGEDVETITRERDDLQEKVDDALNRARETVSELERRL